MDFKDPYVYEGTSVLINRLNIKDKAKLDLAENKFVTYRGSKDIPRGNFDLEHLKSIHKHLFQDIYDWAGQIRYVNIHKGGCNFHPYQLIEVGMSDIHKRLIKQKYLTNLYPREFATQAGIIIGDINTLHPFREGNGRTQLNYLKQLGLRAGYIIDLEKIDPHKWIEASIKAHDADYKDMQDCIARAIDV